MSAKVNLTAYRDTLVITTVDPEVPYPGWSLIGDSLINCSLDDTRAALGASREALDWFARVQPSNDDIGEIEWRDLGDGRKSFSWLGGPFRLVRFDGPDGLRLGPRGWCTFPDDCVVIPNDVPDDARAAIDRAAP